MFRRTLKKRQKVELLLRLLGPLDDARCLLVTCGDNNGAMNYALRAAGGQWTWSDVEEGMIPTMTALLGEPVHHVTPAHLPFRDASFDRVVVIDTHEHLSDVAPLNRELARVAAPDGVVVVTTPNGDPRLPVAVLKRWIGMGPEQYGHVVQGFRREELEGMLVAVGLRPERHGAYARFFTELIELVINFTYLKVLAKGSTRRDGPAPIVPGTEGELRAVAKFYRLYSLAYPLVRAFAALDHLLLGRGGYAVAVTARKPW
jgi:SAM-dependent methyltransferase